MRGSQVARRLEQKLAAGSRSFVVELVLPLVATMPPPLDEGDAKSIVCFSTGYQVGAVGTAFMCAAADMAPGFIDSASGQEPVDLQNMEDILDKREEARAPARHRHRPLPSRLRLAREHGAHHSLGSLQDFFCLVDSALPAFFCRFADSLLCCGGSPAR